MPTINVNKNRYLNRKEKYIYINIYKKGGT